MGVACKPSPRVEAASPLHRSPPATHAASHMQKHSDERAAARARNARLLHDACALAAPPRRGTPAVAALIAARGRYLAAVRLLELRAAAEAKAAAAAVASPAAVFVPPPPALAAPAPPAASVEAAAPTTAAAAEPRRPASPVPRPESSLRFQGGAETEWSSDEGADDGSSDGDAGHKSAAAVAAAAPLEAAAKQAMPPSSSPPPPPPLPPLPAVGGIVPRLDLTGLRPAATEAGLAQGQGDEKVEQSARAPPEARVPRTEPPTAAPAASAAYASAALSPASRRSASGVSPRTGESALLSLGANWSPRRPALTPRQAASAANTPPRPSAPQAHRPTSFAASIARRDFTDPFAEFTASGGGSGSGSGSGGAAVPAMSAAQGSGEEGDDFDLPF